MSTPITATVLCRCGWTGLLTGVAPCPSCGASSQQRVTPVRLLALQEIARDPGAPINQSVRHKLIEMRLIAPAGKRPPAGKSRNRKPRRPHVLTADGLAVRAAAGRIAIDHLRHDVAASVARHADLPVPPQPADGSQGLKALIAVGLLGRMQPGTAEHARACEEMSNWVSGKASKP